MLKITSNNKIKYNINNEDELLLSITTNLGIKNINMVGNVCVADWFNQLNNKSITITEYRKTVYSFFKSKSLFEEIFWTSRGFCEDEAAIIAKQRASQNGHKTMDKYSAEERTERAKIASAANKTMRLKLKDTNMVAYNKLFNTKIEFYLAKGLTIEDAQKALKRRQATFSKEKLINEHGEKIGLDILNSRNTKWVDSLNKNNDMSTINKKKAITLTNMQNKYGDVEGAEKYSHWVESNSWTLKKSISKYGESDGINRWRILCEKKGGNNKSVSTESIDCFKPIIDVLIDLDIEFYCGISGNKEFSLPFNNSIAFYDLTIPIWNKIIEFNGVAFHPRKSWDKVKWNNFVMPYKNLNATEKYNFDRDKIRNAENAGFEVLEVWSEDAQFDRVEEMMKFLNLY